MNTLKEGEDYYFNEEGLMVLTKKFHLQKGFCCGNGCKHCPYDFKNVTEPLRQKCNRTPANRTFKKKSSE